MRLLFIILVFLLLIVASVFAYEEKPAVFTIFACMALICAFISVNIRHRRRSNYYITIEKVKYRIVRDRVLDGDIYIILNGAVAAYGYRAEYHNRDYPKKIIKKMIR